MSQLNTRDIQPGDSIDVQVSDTLTLTGSYVSIGYPDGMLLIRVADALHVIKNYHYFTKTPPPP